MVLQHNKVVNLRLAAARVDRVLIAPGRDLLVQQGRRQLHPSEGLSSRACGSPTARPTSGVGGGICQLANLLHWMVLHSPLTVVERSEHSFDPFPDNGRVLPWGVGCSIAYNYVDLVVRNDTADDVPAPHLGRRAAPARRAARRSRAAGVLLGRRPRRRFERRDGDGLSGVPTRSGARPTTVAPARCRRGAREAQPRGREVPGRRGRARVQATTRPRSTTQAGRSSTDRSSSGLAS